MNHWQLIDHSTGEELFRDNETYRLCEIAKRSGISRSALELKRRQGVLVVLKNHPNMAKGNFVKYALRNTEPHPLVAAGLPKNSVYWQP